MLILPSAILKFEGDFLRSAAGGEPEFSVRV